MTLSEPLIPAEIGRQFLCECANVVVLRVDNDGVISFANRYAKAFTGLTLEGCQLTDMMVNFEAETDPDQWRRPSDKPRMVNVRTVAGLPQTLYVTVIPVLNAFIWFGQVDGEEQERLRREVLVLNHESSQMSRELVQKNAELTQLNALKNQFLGMAAHDLRKPTGLILTYAEFLLEDAADVLPAEQLQQLERIRSAADRMRGLIDDFLDVSLIEAGKLSLNTGWADTAQIVDNARMMVDRAADKRNISIRVSLDSGAKRLWVDGPKIEQVLTNLLSNAVEHSPDGGQVSIGSRLEPTGFRLWVEDQGPGLSAEQQNRLFQAFAGQTNRKPGGERSIGLGLMIAKKIVEAHGGQLQVESTPEKGSLFGFTLPPTCLAVV